MASLASGWNIQTRVIKALMLRELTTRFGRENIGFLWVMAEPLLFASLVALVWRVLRGPEEHGVGIVAFVVSGYVPMIMFRHSLSRSLGSFSANASLMYHRQVKILDIVLVRCLVELIGHMMAYLFIAAVLIAAGLFPIPAHMDLLLLGWTYNAIFTLTVCLVIAPLSEMSPVLEKVMPVTTYIMVPFYGAFYMTAWLTPDAQTAILWFPPVHGMEMMHYGLFGDAVSPHYDLVYPLAVCLPFLALGLALCRRVRRMMVVE